MRQLATLALLVLPTTALAGPWTQARGASYSKISVAYLNTSNEFDHRGRRLDLFEEEPGFEDGSFSDLHLALYGEVGLSDRTTLIGGLPLKALRAERTGLVGGGLLRGVWLAIVRLDGVHNTQPPPDIYGGPVVTPLPGGGGALPDLVIGDQHSLKVSPSIGYTLTPRLSLQVELSHVLSGTNALAGTQMTLGVVMTR